MCTAVLPQPARTRPARGLVVLLLAVAALVITVVLGIALGARDFSALDVLRILAHPGEESYDAQVLWTERIPRTFLGVLVGAALGGAGTVMQELTRNALVDPGVLGLEAGASVAVVVGIVVLGLSGAHAYFWCALVGAVATAALVYAVGVRAAGSSTLGLVLAGAAVSALLASVTTLLVVRDAAVYASLRSWAVGQLTGRSGVLAEAAPFLLVALLALPLVARTLNVLALGEDVAAALGVRVGRAQLAVAAVAVLATAAATAAVGPVAFVGLVAAHTARLLVGSDQRWTLPSAMLTGAVVLLLADVAGRLAPGSGEVSVGITTALVGTPFFVWLARRPQLSAL